MHLSCFVALDRVQPFAHSFLKDKINTGHNFFKDTQFIKLNDIWWTTRYIEVTLRGNVKLGSL